MVSIASLLLKTVAKKFYERNTGFFLFIFYLMFGVVESSQIVSYHLSLIHGLLNSPVFLSLAGMVWILYMAKCFAFVSDFISLNENNFLYQLLLLPYRQRLSWLIYILILIDIPIITYVMLIVGVGLNQQLFGVISFIILFHAILITTAAFLFELKINSLKPSRFKWPTFQRKRPLPFPLFYLIELFHRHKLIFFFSKLFSFVSIIGFISIPLDHYEYRTALMGLLFGITAHAVMVFEFRKLEESRMSFLRNLPLTFLNRYIQIVLTYSMLLIPEGLVLLVNHTPLLVAVGIYSFGVGLLTLSHCRLYLELNNDKHIQWTLGLFLISFMLVLFQVYLIELALVWLMAYLYLKRYFYFFELKAE